jgi:class I fructose-bisphosphate aldolase
VTDACFKPVVILGGGRRSSEADILAEVRAAMDEGASGATIGRNIFEADDPETMTAALSAIIHQDASVEQALAILRGA